MTILKWTIAQYKSKLRWWILLLGTCASMHSCMSPWRAFLCHFCGIKKENASNLANTLFANTHIESSSHVELRYSITITINVFLHEYYKREVVKNHQNLHPHGSNTHQTKQNVVHLEVRDIKITNLIVLMRNLICWDNLSWHIIHWWKFIKTQHDLEVITPSKSILK
jgi:hypothetical protein